jgi:hypothetical protein
LARSAAVKTSAAVNHGYVVRDRVKVRSAPAMAASTTNRTGSIASTT